MKKEIDVDLLEAMSNIEMRVNQEWGFKLNIRNRLRVFLGLKLLKIGCRLCGIDFVIEDEQKPQTPADVWRLN